MPKIVVLGAGAWGTALALVGARAGSEAVIVGRDAQAIRAINEEGRNPRLPGIDFDVALRATDDLAAAAGADAVVLAVPAQSVRAVSSSLASHLGSGTPLVIAAKGIERGSGKRMSEVVAETVPQAIPAILSGPSFADDVARGLPTAVTIAAREEALALSLCHAFQNASFRPYAETDVTGVEIGGALKNVFAIAAGIVSGRKLGASALAALVARGFAELRRFGEALGAKPETLMGLSGLGDLVLTCSGPQSRNFAFGAALGAGGTAASTHPLVEGIETALVARDMAEKLGIAMPVVEAVAWIIEGRITVGEAIEGLMNRPIRRETD